MSPAKKYILDIVTPLMESHGFRFYKGSSTYSKKENDLDYRIRVRFDGRGGLTLIDALEFSIESPHYNRITKKLVGSQTNLVGSGVNFFTEGKIIIPVPYSQKALDVANTMNMSELAKIPFEEKYPVKRMDNTAQKAFELMEARAFPFFDKYQSLDDIYNLYAHEPEAKGNPLNLWRYRRRLYGSKLRVLCFVLIAHDLGKPIPDILLKYKHFYKDMVEGFGHMGKTTSLKKNLKSMGVSFNPK